MMLYRQTELGGLGIYNVKLRATAMLIHTFLAQAVSPLFPTNIYLNSLYRWHVLDQRESANPGRPPYFSADFFAVIKDVHQNTPLNVAWITLKQWYQLLLERGETHTSDDPDSPPVLILSRLEQSRPAIDYKHSYRISRIFGLAPEQKSFLFKMIQNLLPTRERLHRIGKSQSPSCNFCNGQDDTTEHLFTCPQSSEVTTPLCACLSSQADNLTFKDVTEMNIHTPESWELPAAWLVSTCLNMVWDERLTGRRSSFRVCQAELSAKIALLRSTKWKHYSLNNIFLLLDKVLNLHLSYYVEILLLPSSH
jgi:hypothetical protein